MDIVTLSILTLGFLAFTYAMGELAGLVLKISRDADRTKERAEREEMEAADAARERRLAELKRWRESMGKGKFTTSAKWKL